MTHTDARGSEGQERRGDPRCLCTLRQCCGISPACSFSVGRSFVLLNSGFKCSLPHRDGDRGSVHPHPCILWVLPCSPLPVLLQDPADAGGRMIFFVIFNIFLKDESQGEGQEAFLRGRVAQPP